MPKFLRSIRVRLAMLVLAGMFVLAGFLVYQKLDQRRDDLRDGDENLRRLATFGAYAQRERFDSARNLLELATAAPSLRTVALTPDAPDAFDACTRALFVLDQLQPETAGFALWDTEGRTLCSSEAAKPGEFSAADRLWFQTAREQGALATGGYQLSPPDDTPSIGFGLPLKDAAGVETIAYLSVDLRLNRTNEILASISLPDTGRVAIVDAQGTIISSTGQRSGQPVENFVEQFSGLKGFLDSDFGDGPNDRSRATVRITDEDDTLVAVTVSAERQAFASPVPELLVRELWPVLLVTLFVLAALWFLSHQWIVRPIESLVKTSSALAAGNLGARARVARGVAELEVLGVAYNEMAETRERATHAKDEFLSLISHELRTPITTALGNASVLRDHGEEIDAELRQTALDDIHEAALRLNMIIDNLLALARLERGVGLDSEPLSLVRMARGSAGDQLNRMPGRVINIHGDGTALALGGVVYVEQVLDNLIGNALKYSRADAPVDVIVERDGAVARVRVCDRGSGVAESERESIFTPFYRSDTTSGLAEGVGIGLSVCRRLIEAMGGKIWCVERDGGGTEFIFTLPLAEEDGLLEFGDEPAPAPGPAPPSAAPEPEGAVTT